MGDDSFMKTKKHVLPGSGLGIIIWMGFFDAFGGAFFQMWQAAIGAAPLTEAFQYSVSCSIVFIIVNMDDA